MDSGFNYKEYVDWVKKLGETEKAFKQWLENFLLEQAYRVLAKGKPRTPVDTGYLKNSWYVGDIQWIGHSLQVEIGLSAEYASYVEYDGITRNYEGKYMLAISIDEVQQQLPARFNQEWLEFLADKGVV